MQHTDKYNLNIIETTDDFSPEPLNENARALETQLAALDAAKAEQIALEALTGQLAAETAARKALDAGQLVYKLGSYTGTGNFGSSNKNRLTFDFMPLVLIVSPTGSAPSYGGYPWVRNTSRGRTSDTKSVPLTWENQAVSWYDGNDPYLQLNISAAYYYLAIGVKV